MASITFLQRSRCATFVGRVAACWLVAISTLFWAMPVCAQTFAAPMSYPTDWAPIALAIGDFNGDGRPDVAIANQSSYSITVLLNMGGGVLAKVPASVNTGAMPSRIIAGDFNGDGKLDLAVANAGSRTIGIYLGNGDGTFRVPTTIAMAFSPGGLAAADFNGDGRLDLAIATNAAAVTVFRGNGDGTFSAGVSYATGAAAYDVLATDLNGDGRPDLVVTNINDNTLSSLINNGDGTFAPALTIATGYRPASIAVADFNRDGRPDLVVQNGIGYSVHLGRGDGGFLPAATTSLGFTTSEVTVGDFNGDGAIDFAIGNLFNSAVAVFLGRGDGTFQPAQSVATTRLPDAIAAGPLRGNGASDLVTTARVNNLVSVLLNTVVSTPTASLAVHAGSPQSTTIGSAFPVPLSVDVRDASGRPVQGTLVTFTAPGSSASATFPGAAISATAISGADGIATAPTLTANMTPGSFTVVATAGTLSASFVLTNVDGSVAPSFSTAPPPGGPWGSAYRYTVHANGNPPPTYAIASGSLPPGLTLDPVSGAISGTPPVMGAYTGSLSASNGINPPATQAFSIVIGPAVQSISFAPLGSRALGAPPFTISATASSGLQVAFASLSTAVCTVSGNQVSLVAAGTCAIRATQPGNASYGPAPSVDQSFAVTASLQPQSIVFTLPATTVLGSPVNLSAVASSGLPVSFASLTTAACTVAGDVATPVAAGTCTIRASQAGNATYAAAANVDRSLEITAPAAAQTISFVAPADQPYRAAPFTLSASSSSGLPVSFATLTPATCDVSGATVSVLTVGTCTLRASQAGNAAFLPAPSIDRSFNVTRAPQAITFAPITLRALGNPPFEIHATSSSGLAVAFTSMSPETCRLNGQWLNFLAVGTCAIRATQSGDGNFLAAAAVDQSFTIGPATQTLLFAQPPTQSMMHPHLVPSASASSGLPVTFSSLTPATCTADGATVTLIAAGTCAVRATQAGDENYAAVSADRSFNVLGSGSAPAADARTPGPMIAYSTLLGGFGSTASAHDTAFDIGVTSNGAAVVGGSVAGSFFPGIDASQVTNGGLDLLFVARLSPDRGAVDSVSAVGARTTTMTGSGGMPYIGATATDMAEALALDSAGDAYVAAYSGSRTYPATGGTYVRTAAKAVFRVTPAGTVTMLPVVLDPSIQSIRALAVDAAGSIYLTGYAGAGMATTIGAAVSSASAPSGGPYLLKLAPGGTSVVYATYLTVAGTRPSVAPSGQATFDVQTTAYALAVDGFGNAYVAGQAKAGDFPVTPGAPDTTDNQNRDAFVAKVNTTGSALLWIARLGGADAERATSIALAPDGSVVIGGKAATRPFVGSEAFQVQVPFQQLDPFCYCNESGFVAKLAPDGSRWIFIAALGTFGGSLVRNAQDIWNVPVKVAIDSAGAIFAAGYTSADRQLPLGSRAVGDIGFSAIQSPGRYDDSTLAAMSGPAALLRGNGGFLMKISADGRELLYSVLINSGPVTALKVDAFGAAYVAGMNANVPQIDAAQAAPGSVFVAKVLSQSTPLALTVSPSPSAAAGSVTLTASLADARYAGAIEFRDGDSLVGSAATTSGSATLSLLPSIGVHRFTATFVGPGPWSGSRSTDVVHTVTQAGVSP